MADQGDGPSPRPLILGKTRRNDRREKKIWHGVNQNRPPPPLSPQILFPQSAELQTEQLLLPNSISVGG